MATVQMRTPLTDPNCPGCIRNVDDDLEWRTGPDGQRWQGEVAYMQNVYMWQVVGDGYISPGQQAVNQAILLKQAADRLAATQIAATLTPVRIFDDPADAFKGYPTPATPTGQPPTQVIRWLNSLTLEQRARLIAYIRAKRAGEIAGGF